MGKHVKKKRLSIERVVETVSPDVIKEKETQQSSVKLDKSSEPKDNNKDNKDKNKEGCRCCGVLDCFKIETNNNNNINGKNNVVDNNKETSLNIGVNSKK